MDRGQGGTVLTGVSKKLDFLVVGANPWYQACKARKLGIEEISEKQLFGMDG